MSGSRWRGVALVAKLEVQTRLRTRRWPLLLAAWFVLTGLVAVGARLLSDIDGDPEPGVPTFGLVLLFVLLLSLLVAPTLTAQAINGERERGTLAALQLTSLTPQAIAFGKLLAAWGTGLILLAIALPFLAWPVLEGDVPVARAVAAVVVVALLIGVVCAVAMAWSALVVRCLTSALLAYLSVFALTIGTLMLYNLAEAFAEDRAKPTWLLAAPNPFVILVDAVPKGPGPALDDPDPTADPLADLAYEIRGRPIDGESGVGPVWPFGLAADLLLGAGAFQVTVRRLRTPVKELPEGVRIA